jgi:hypothetical protein
VNNNWRRKRAMDQSKTGGGTFRSLRENLLRKYILGIVLLEGTIYLQ